MRSGQVSWVRFFGVFPHLEDKCQEALGPKVPEYHLAIIIIHIKVASWRKRLGARLPSLGSRVRVSVPPCGFCGGRNEVWVGFSRGFSRFPLPQISFHHFSTLISFISFHFISSAPVMVRQVESADILAIYIPSIKGLHRISPLDPALCRTRVEDILHSWTFVFSKTHQNTDDFILAWQFTNHSVPYRRECMSLVYQS